MNLHLQKLIDHFARERGKVCCYVNNDKSLDQIISLVSSLNCSVLLLCEPCVNLESCNLSNNLQIVPIEIITKVTYSNKSKLEETFQESYSYYNTIEILLTVLKPTCMLLPTVDSIQEKIIRTICKELDIIALSGDLMPEQREDWIKFIRQHIPYGDINHYDVPKLHIGCAYYMLSGWFNADIDCKNGSYFLDAGREYPFPDKSFKYIFSEHLFEHLTFKQGVNMLKECHRILTDDGCMRIAMPNMEFLMDLYFNPDKEINKAYIRWSTNTFLPDVKNLYEENEYQSEYVINNFFRDWGHQQLHTPHEFELLAYKCGFQNIRRCQVGESDINVFNNIEQHGSSIPEWANQLETFVYELEK